MKGNTKKTGMYGFGAYWAKIVESRQKPMQLPSSRKNGGTGMNSPEEKHMRHLRRKMSRAGGVPRGKMNKKMYRLGWRSECRKDLTRATQ